MSGITNSKKRARDQLITQCKRCERGIYENQPRYWVPRPRPGLIHAACSGSPS